MTVCEGVEDRSPVYLNEISGATIEMILDATGKLGVLNSFVSSKLGDFIRNSALIKLPQAPLLTSHNTVKHPQTVMNTHHA